MTIRLLLIMIMCISLTSFKFRSALPVPEIVLHIKLTEAAELKLTQSGEVISGTFYFDGPGTPFHSNRKNSPYRSVFLGEYRFEIGQAGEVRFTDAIISREAFDRLSDENYYFFLNIYSGRRVFENNILRGGYVAGRFEDLKLQQPIHVNLSLLSE